MLILEGVAIVARAWGKIDLKKFFLIIIDWATHSSTPTSDPISTRKYITREYWRVI